MIQGTLSELPSALPEVVDLYICSASFEKRSTSISNHLNGVSLGESLVCYNLESRDIVSESLESLMALLGTPTPVPLSKYDPASTLETLMGKLLRNPSSDRTILVDITTFTHETLLILLRVLKFALSPLDRLLLAYSPASAYSAKAKGRSKWLTKGVRDVRSVLGYPGQVFPHLKTHLVILVGHEWERAEQLIRKFEPAAVSLGVGTREDSMGEEHYKLNVAHFNRLTQRYHNVNSFEFACNDPLRTCQEIIRTVTTYTGYNSVVAPMNTKLSTVGAALAAWRIPQIQLCYAQPSIYNFSDYSDPSDRFYLFELSAEEFLY